MSTAPASGRTGRPTKESNAELELIALRGAVFRFVIECTPPLRRLEAATYELGPAAHQHTAHLRHGMTRLALRGRSPLDL